MIFQSQIYFAVLEEEIIHRSIDIFVSLVVILLQYKLLQNVIITVILNNHIALTWHASVSGTITRCALHSYVTAVNGS